MRNLKPSEAALRRERFDVDLPLEPAPPPRLEARIEEVSGFDSEPLARRASRPRFGRWLGRRPTRA